MGRCYLSPQSHGTPHNITWINYHALHTEVELSCVTITLFTMSLVGTKTFRLNNVYISLVLRIFKKSTVDIFLLWIFRNRLWDCLNEFLKYTLPLPDVTTSASKNKWRVGGSTYSVNMPSRTRYSRVIVTFQLLTYLGKFCTDLLPAKGLLKGASGRIKCISPLLQGRPWLIRMLHMVYQVSYKIFCALGFVPKQFLFQLKSFFSSSYFLFIPNWGHLYALSVNITRLRSRSHAPAHPLTF